MTMFKSTLAKTPEEYISSLLEPGKKSIQTLHDLITQTIPDKKPFIISGMIGYGPYKYKSASGRQGDWALICLAQQKNYISLYVCAMKDGKYISESFKDKLPKASVGKSCIRFKKLEDVDLSVVKQIILEANNQGGMGQLT